jgi:hypothetical protein
MKALVGAQSPKIIAANIGRQKLSEIEAVAARVNAKVIFADNLQNSPANILGEKKTKSEDFGKFDDPADECLVFAGFEKGALTRTLDLLKARGATVTLKAIYTPFNRDWSLAHLINELAREHSAMTGGEKNE